jgi:hypothetical protein
MHDPRDGQVRYLIHFDDGGRRDALARRPLQPGAELRDGHSRYRVERVEQPPNPHSFA